VSFTGATKYQGRDFTFTAAPVSLVIAPPFTLALEPAPLKVSQGGKARLKVTAARRAGYQGPIALEVRNLPANVTAPKAVIPMAGQSAEIEVSAAPDAALASKANVSVLGTAVAAANQQFASPNLTVIVQPPPPPFELKVEPAALRLVPGGKVKLKVTA